MTLDAEDWRKLHSRILERLQKHFDMPVMGNVDSGMYVEYLIAESLGPCWRSTALESGWWAAWDCEHVQSGARLEIKQSTARQLWDGDGSAPKRHPSFDIKPRKGYWTQDGSRWIEYPEPMRAADIYVFAWHGEREHGIADHRDADQWLFRVVAEPDLPPGQKTIVLSKIRPLSRCCGFADLRQTVEFSVPVESKLKKTLERSFGVQER